MDKQNEVTLYGKGAYGTNVWKIWSEGNMIYIGANGSVFNEEIPIGKASRSLMEQIRLRINARVRGKLDSGFKRIESELRGVPTNQLDLALPMLATPFKNVARINLDKCYVQPKLDGHRCLITRQEGKIIAYSRRGKLIETLDHITQDIDIPEGVTLDGELYLHGIPLQTIASWSKRKQANTAKIQYHVYDIMDPAEASLGFPYRYNYLEDFSFWNKRIHLVETAKGFNFASIGEAYKNFKTAGYEGAILRPEKGVYQPGKRAKDLIKVKMREDGEFKCVDIIPSREGWGILILETKEGARFKCLAPGPVAFKIATLHNKEEHIGNYVTCEYANLTEDRIPFHCVAMSWRRDI